MVKTNRAAIQTTIQAATQATTQTTAHHDDTPAHCALSLDNVQFSWTPNASNLLHIDHLSLAQGESVLLHGPSGSGKSTLLNIITGVLPPQAGQVHVADQSLWSLSSSKRDHFRAKRMGVITQSLNLVPYLSVLDNLKLMLSFANARFSLNDIEQLLDTLNLSDQIHQTVATLSIGQRQRAAIARALVHSPALIIADEPTSALDSDNAHAFMSHLKNSVQTNKTSLLMVTHDLSLAQYVDRSIDINTLKPSSTSNQAGGVC